MSCIYHTEGLLEEGPWKGTAMSNNQNRAFFNVVYGGCNIQTTWRIPSVDICGMPREAGSNLLEHSLGPATDSKHAACKLEVSKGQHVCRRPVAKYRETLHPGPNPFRSLHYKPTP